MNKKFLLTVTILGAAAPFDTLVNAFCNNWHAKSTQDRKQVAPDTWERSSPVSFERVEQGPGFYSQVSQVIHTQQQHNPRAFWSRPTLQTHPSFFNSLVADFHELFHSFFLHPFGCFPRTHQRFYMNPSTFSHPQRPCGAYTMIEEVEDDRIETTSPRQPCGAYAMIEEIASKLGNTPMPLKGSMPADFDTWNAQLHEMEEPVLELPNHNSSKQEYYQQMEKAEREYQEQEEGCARKKIMDAFTAQKKAMEHKTSFQTNENAIRETLMTKEALEREEILRQFAEQSNIIQADNLAKAEQTKKTGKKVRFDENLNKVFEIPVIEKQTPKVIQLPDAPQSKTAQFKPFPVFSLFG